MDEATATKVPQTGSFFSSPPDRAACGASGDLPPPAETWENAWTMIATTFRTNSATIVFDADDLVIDAMRAQAPVDELHDPAESLFRRAVGARR